MTDINSLEILSKIRTKEKEDDPNFPLAPFKRIIKMNTKDKYVSSDAAVQLKEIIYELSKEITEIADKICDLTKKKTINAEMIQKAYEIIRENK